MSRTINTIYNEIITEKETFTSLDGLEPVPDEAQTLLANLTTASKVAVWRLIFYVVAFAIWIHESLFDSFKYEVEVRVLEIISGVLRWYVSQCKAFQFGDDLIWTGEKYEYADIISSDAIAKQIVTHAAANETNGTIVIKIAKTTSGVLAKLSVAEKAAFAAYVDKIKFAGTITQIISEDNDLLWIGATIYYDPLVLDSSGTLLSDGTTKPVEVAISGYIQGLPFDGIFTVAELVDAIQLAEGVVNIVVTICKGKYTGIAYIDILNVTSQTYSARAGYMDIDLTYPLSGTLTYISD